MNHIIPCCLISTLPTYLYNIHPSYIPSPCQPHISLNSPQQVTCINHTVPCYTTSWIPTCFIILRYRYFVSNTLEFMFLPPSNTSQFISIKIQQNLLKKFPLWSQNNFFFFFSRRYNPWWVLACFMISFHNLLSLHFSLQLLTFISFKSSSTWSSHLSLGLPTGLDEHGSHSVNFLTVLVVSILITCATQRNLCDFINLTIFFF